MLCLWRIHFERTDVAGLPLCTLINLSLCLFFTHFFLLFLFSSIFFSLSFIFPSRLKSFFIFIFICFYLLLIFP